jgi:glycosyltransferase involved in cell wall biosynthesis
VWCPGAAGDGQGHLDDGITVHRVAGGWRPADFARLDRGLDACPGPRRLIVQWVPHAFGRKSLNVGFCAWIRRRALAGDVVDVMVHEAFFAFGEGGIKQDGAAVVHRIMVMLLLSRANHVWVSIPAWARALRPYGFGRDLGFDWLPVPSNIPKVTDPEATAAARARAAFPAADAIVVGHFGTYERQVRRRLAALLPPLLARVPAVNLLLMGRDSEQFAAALSSSHPPLSGRIHGTGLLDARRLSITLQACDLMVQPYPDGASTRRGSLMAALSHGRPVVTTEGHLSEPLWRDSHAVRIVPAADDTALLDAMADLCTDAGERQRLAVSGEALYAQQFDVARTIDAMLARPARLVACPA